MSNIRIYIASVLMFLYANLNGVMTVYYDCRDGSLKSSKWLTLYAYGCNLYMAIMTPIFLYRNLSPHSMYESYVLLNFASYALLVFNCLAIVIVILLRAHRQRVNLDICMRLQKIKSQRANKPTKMLTILVALLYGKCITVVANSIMMFMWSITDMVKIDCVLDVFLTAYAFMVNTMVFGVMLQYISILVVICSMINDLNGDLAELVHKQMPPDDHSYIDSMADIDKMFTELRKLIRFLCYNYKMEFMSMRLMLFLDYVVQGYGLLVMIKSHVQDVTLPVIVSILIWYIMLVADMVIQDLVSELTSEYAKQTNHVLREFTVLERGSISQRIDRYANSMALQYATFKAQVTYFGTFQVNRKQTFAIASSAFLYTIFMVQWDYKKIWH